MYAVGEQEEGVMLMNQNYQNDQQKSFLMMHPGLAA